MVPRLGVRAVKVPDLFAVAEEAAVEECVSHETHPYHHEHVEDLTEEELPKVDVVPVQHAPTNKLIFLFEVRTHSIVSDILIT